VHFLCSSALRLFLSACRQGAGVVRLSDPNGAVLPRHGDQPAVGEPARQDVKGASQGIGRETALVLAAEGCDLVLVSRDARRLNDLAGTIRSQHGFSVSVVAADLSETEAVERVGVSVARIDVPVNNAGAIPPGTGCVWSASIDGGPA
jgi:hypothetical protein